VSDATAISRQNIAHDVDIRQLPTLVETGGNPDTPSTSLVTISRFGPANGVTSTTISTIVTLTQAAYDALAPPNPSTLYVVVG
jgi:hypothetical protein